MIFFSRLANEIFPGVYLLKQKFHDPELHFIGVRGLVLIVR